MTLAIAGLALGFGTMFPQFETENAAQIPTSFGGLVFMMSSVALIGAVVMLEARPVYTYLSRRRRTARRSTRWGWSWGSARPRSLCAAGDDRPDPRRAAPPGARRAVAGAGNRPTVTGSEMPGSFQAGIPNWFGTPLIANGYASVDRGELKMTRPTTPEEVSMKRISLIAAASVLFAGAQLHAQADQAGHGQEGHEAATHGCREQVGRDGCRRDRGQGRPRSRVRPSLRRQAAPATTAAPTDRAQEQQEVSKKSATGQEGHDRQEAVIRQRDGCRLRPRSGR